MGALRTGLFASAAFAASFGAAWAWSPAAADPATSGEQAEALRADLVPVAFEEEGDGSASYRFELELESRFGRDARTSYAVELVTDRGVAVTKPRTVAPFSLRTRAQRRDGVELPKHLADGFYELRVTAVGRDASDAASVVRSTYLEVRKGRTEILTHDEFYGRSAANVGVSR